MRRDIRQADRRIAGYVEAVPSNREPLKQSGQPQRPCAKKQSSTFNHGNLDGFNNAQRGRPGWDVGESDASLVSTAAG
jgi:hypothetical protein